MTDVGRHSVIGAGSVVTKPIPDYSIAAGVPAKVIRSRRKGLHSGESRIWNLEAQSIGESGDLESGADERVTQIPDSRFQLP